MTEKRGLGRPKTAEHPSITFKLPGNMDQAIRELAEREFRTVSGQVLHMLEHYILFGQRSLQQNPSDFGQMVAQVRRNNESGI
jgi:hypothetical protein